MVKALERVGQFVQNLFSPESDGEWPAPGLYHFVHSVDGYDHHAHLRIEKDGSAIMFVDANSIIYLNATAAFITFWYLQDKSKEAILSWLNSMFYDPSSIETDYQQTIDRITGLLSPEKTCPVCDLDLELSLPFSTEPLAPYRMDLAITYRCNNDCAHCYNARSRRFPELEEVQWKHIIDKISLLS